MSLHLNSLPDDCLRLIFTRLPLRELVRLRLTICTHWFTLIDQLFLSTSSLQLFTSPSEVTEINRAIFEHNIDGLTLDQCVLILSSTTQDGIPPTACPSLPSLFPNLRLLAFRNTQNTQSYFPEMLSAWSPTLTKLIIKDLPKDALLLTQTWSSLGQLSKLEFFNLIGAFRTQIPDDLAILPKLRIFSLVHYLPSLVPTLSRLASVRDLNLSWVYLSRDQLREAITVNPELTQLRSLKLGFIFSPNGSRESNFEALFGFICEALPRLTTLDIMFADHLPLSTLIPHLSHLPSLSTLWLYIGRHQLDHPTPYSLPPLPSVTSLKLEIFDLSVDQFYTWIGHLFPRLEKLTLRCPDFTAEKQASLTARFSRELPNIKKRKLKFL